MGSRPGWAASIISMILISITGLVLALIWWWRAGEAVIGMRSVPELAGPEWDCWPHQPPSLSIIVPAKDEELAIEQALESLLALDYPEYEVIAVNDRSTDRTGELMDLVAARHRARRTGPQLRVLHIQKLPAGWLGKNHAMWRAAEASTSGWLLFTDGDIIHRADGIRRALAYAGQTGCDHLVMLPSVDMHSWGERMMITYFGAQMTLAFRPWKASDPKAPDQIGMGAFNLIKRSAYEAIGTHEALRLEVVDDIRLGKRIKDFGFKQGVANGRDLVRLRWVTSAFGFVSLVRKNLFAIVFYRWELVWLAALLLIFLNLGPWGGFIFAPGRARAGFGVALLAILLVYLGTARNNRVSPLYFFTHPIASVLFIYALFSSAWTTWRQGGVRWRETFYSLQELRAAIEDDSLMQFLRRRS